MGFGKDLEKWGKKAAKDTFKEVKKDAPGVAKAAGSVLSTASKDVVHVADSVIHAPAALVGSAGSTLSKLAWPLAIVGIIAVGAYVLTNRSSSNRA